MQDQTMIKIERKTVEVLKSLKIVERESYNEVIRRIIDNYLEDSLELSDKSKLKIKKGLEDIKKGKVLSSSEALEYFNKK